MSAKIALEPYIKSTCIYTPLRLKYQKINQKEQAVIIANSNNHFYIEGMTCCTILQKDQPTKYISHEYRPKIDSPKTQAKTYQLESFPTPIFPNRQNPAYAPGVNLKQTYIQ